MMKALYRFSDALDEFCDWFYWEWPRLFLFGTVVAIGVFIYAWAAGWGS